MFSYEPVSKEDEHVLLCSFHCYDAYKHLDPFVLAAMSSMCPTGTYQLNGKYDPVLKLYLYIFLFSGKCTSVQKLQFMYALCMNNIHALQTLYPETAAVARVLYPEMKKYRTHKLKSTFEKMSYEETLLRIPD